MKLLIIVTTFVSIMFSLNAHENHTIYTLLDKNFKIITEHFLVGEIYFVLENDRPFYSLDGVGEFKEKKQIIYYCKTSITDSICIKP